MSFGFSSSAGYCSSSQGIRDYGSTGYCLASCYRDSYREGNSSSASSYDQASDRGDRGDARDFVFEQSTGFKAVALTRACPVEQLNQVNPQSVEQLHAASAKVAPIANGLQLSIKNLQASVELKQKNVAQLSLSIDQMTKLIQQMEAANPLDHSIMDQLSAKEIALEVGKAVLKTLIPEAARFIELGKAAKDPNRKMTQEEILMFIQPMLIGEQP